MNTIWSALLVFSVVSSCASESSDDESRLAVEGVEVFVPDSPPGFPVELASSIGPERELLDVDLDSSTGVKALGESKPESDDVSLLSKVDESSDVVLEGEGRKKTSCWRGMLKRFRKRRGK